MATSRPRRSKSLPGHLPNAVPGEVLVWTDGACRRNPGPGGWAALLCWEDGIVEEYSGGLALTTNNIMEMTAALEGLRALPSGSRVCVVTDSRYLHDGMTSWMAGWKRRGWTTASGAAPGSNRIRAWAESVRMVGHPFDGTAEPVFQVDDRPPIRAR